MKKILELFAALALTLAIATPSMAADDIDTLRRQLDEQRALNQAQQQQLERRALELDHLSQRLEEMAADKAVSARAVAAAPQPAPEGASPGGSAYPVESSARDTVGDLNAEGVKAGEFPGSIKIPGTGNVSMAIGGFIKTAAIFDSEAENMGADFLPANLGTRRPDRNGAFSLDATLTRLFLDGRAPVARGQVRGYIEADLNNTNDGSLGVKLRQAYGAWTPGTGTLLAGHTWSTLMDLKILPEGLTEPTVSGVIFMRQPSIRWSQPINPQLSYHIALEDASSNDVFSEEPSFGNTSLPDAIAGLEFVPSDNGHLRLNGIVRKVEIDLSDSSATDDAMGWGLSLTGHLKLPDRDRLVFSGVYGQGLGRYLLGIQSIAGGAVDPAHNTLVLRDNWGGMVSYIHHWTDALRSSAMAGYAHAEPFDWQAGDAFESSAYAAVNLMWSIQPFLTLGLEYAYGIRENKDGSELDNHRIGIGIQMF